MKQDSARVALAVAAVCLLVALPAFVWVSVSSKLFLVGDGYFTSRTSSEPDYSRRRSCVGARYTPESRDGFHTNCIGIPIGAWRCYATLPDEGGSWEVPCH